MALSFPYSLAFFSDVLPVKKCSVSLQRFDERSGSGDGRIWVAQLAPPLWTAAIDLSDCKRRLARQIEARIDGLDGSRGTFLFADPTYSGPTGGMIGDLTGVTVSGIRAADRGAVALTGMPQGQRIEPGDYLSITHTGGRVYFATFAEAGTANAAGNIAQREIRPYLPMGISVGASVELVRPYFRAMVTDYTPFDFDLPHGEVARGGSLKIIQKP